VDRERLILGDQGSELIKFPLEKEEPIVSCEDHVWRRNTKPDERYGMIGSTSLFMLQDSNGVLQKIFEEVPEFFDNYEYNYL
jgi:hypothetical protein